MGFYNILLCSASLTVPAGTLAGNIGKFRMFTAGAILLTLSSFISFVSVNISVLLISRGLAGCGAAALLATGPAILSSITDKKTRNIAFSWFGATIGGGLAFGPLLAALVSSSWGWRVVFLGQATLFSVAVIMLFVGQENENSPQAPTFRILDAVIYVSTFFCVFFVIIEGPTLGFSDLRIRVLDLSRNCAAPLTAYYALKENTHGKQTNSRI